MAVRISILSGKRRGETFETELSQFRVGGDSSSELSLDPEGDAGVRGRVVAFELREEGWIASSAGAVGVLLSDKPLETARRVRSGDIIRFSSQGPEICFELVTTSRATFVGAEAGGVSRPEVPHTRATAPAVSYRRRWVLVGLLTLTCVGIAVWASTVLRDMPVELAETTIKPTAIKPDSPQPALSPTAAPPAAAESTPARDSKPMATDPPQSLPNAKPANESAAIETKESEPVHTTPPSDQGWPSTLDQLKNATLMLAIEQPRTYSTWPFASACAIDKNLLVTSANAAIELDGFIKKGWKVWAINAATGTKAEVRAFRVHAGFLASRGQPDKQVYFDVALGETDLDLPDVAHIAGAAELDALDSGQALSCIATAPEIRVLSRFESIEPEIYPVRILVVTALPPPPGPRLLHLKGEFPRKPYGGIIVDADGKVCAIFADSAVSPPEARLDLKLSYAPVIEPELLTPSALSGKSEIWVTPPPVAVSSPIAE